MPITWQNINAPDFRASMLGMGQASQSLNTAGAQLQQLIANQGKLNNENWDNQARINTNTMIGESEAAANLGAFHAQDPNYDIGSGQDRFGAQVDMAAVAEGRAATLAKLQGLAGNAATTEANTVFDTDQSAAAAGQAFKNSILSQGGTEEEANAGAVDYMKKGLALKQAAVAEQNDKTSNDLLASMDFSGGDPVALKQQAREQIGDPNFDYSTIDKGIDAGVNQTNEVVDRKDVLNNRNETQNIKDGIALINQEINSLPPSENPVTYARRRMDQLKIGPTAAGVAFDSFLTNRSNLTNVQEAELKNYTNAVGQKFTGAIGALKEEERVLNTPTDKAQAAPYSDKFAESITNMGLKEPGGVITVLGKLTGDPFFNVFEEHGDDIKATLSASKSKMMVDGIPDEAADIILVQAFNNIGGLQDDGIDETKHTAEVLRLAKQYKAHQKFLEGNLPRTNEINKKIREYEDQAKSTLDLARHGIMRANLTNSTYNFPKID